MRVRIALTAMVMMLLGAVVMILSAQPIADEPADGLSSFSWPIVIVPALLLGAGFGLVIGLVGRRSTAPRKPVTAVIVCAVLAFLPVSLPLAQFGGDDSTDSNNLIAALSGWALYHVLSTALATLAARRDRRVARG